MHPLQKALTAISLITAITAFFVGMRAAWWWFKASEVSIDPGWNTGEPGDTRPSMPADLEGDGQSSGWITAIMENIRVSSELNRRAATLTAVSVFLAGVASVTGALPAFMK